MEEQSYHLFPLVCTTHILVELKHKSHCKPEVYKSVFLNLFDKSSFSNFQKIFDKYQLSIEIYIKQLIAYAHKNGLEDPFFRRLKLNV
jgi:hypothetical protein